METTVLVVDDDRHIREFVAELLQDEGYVVATAINGRAALDLLMSVATLPRLIVLDFMMPVMDGAQFLQQVRQHEALSALPVIVLSAATNVQQHVQDFAPVAILKKPFHGEHLLTLIRTYT